VISGVLDADAGEAEVFGVEWSKLSISKKTDRRGEMVGFVFQQFNLIPCHPRAGVARRRIGGPAAARGQAVRTRV
jgi:predicted ABC-type transport system involved in lysophospholipase L1 biosynthesis ATPase subunit